MTPSYMFPAILRTGTGKALAEGFGFAVNNEGRVAFESDFVPLFKMGERVQIVRTKQGIHTHLLTGQVYISAPTVLHITSAEEIILDGASRCIAVECSISTELIKIGRDGGVLGEVPVTLYSLSPDRLHFAAGEEFEDGDSFLLSIESPFVVKNIHLQIYRCLLFGQDKTSYQCKITEISQSSLQNLKRYIMEQIWLHHSVLRSPIEDEYPRY